MTHNLPVKSNTLAFQWSAESAYHEAGHIVVAGAVGSDLRPRGIVIDKVQNVTDGLACYWEDTEEAETVLLALRAGLTEFATRNSGDTPAVI